MMDDLGATGKLTVRKDGVLVGTQKIIDFITGSSITLTAVEDPATGKVSLTIASTASGGGTPRALTGGRLTLTSGTSVTTADVTAAGTIYYTPHIHDLIALYDGSAWQDTVFTEKSLALTATSGKNYDVYGYLSGGALALELSAAWTNDTTRATALTTQDGVYVKSGAVTRRYLGTIRASAANKTEDSAAKRFVWNSCWRVPRPMKVVEATNSWNYTTATWRQSNANTANQLDYVCGLALDSVQATAYSINTGTTPNSTYLGIGVDSTTTPDMPTYLGTGLAVGLMHPSTYNGIPGLGRHFLAWLEYSEAAGTTTWYGDNGGTLLQAGITGWVMA